MRELLTGIVTTIGALIVFTPTILIGAVHSIVYAFYMPIKEKDALLFFRIIWRLIDGTLGAVGAFLFEGFAINYDKLGNVWGEWIEDACTVEENTQFGKKGITISASVGELEYEKRHMFKRARVLSNVLNVAFQEEQHALGSWLLKLERDRIKRMNLKGKNNG